jgi:D-alanyl-D-alanine carboxypeptidase
MSEHWFEGVGLAESPFVAEAEAPPDAWPQESAALPPAWPEDEADGGEQPFTSEAWTPWAPAEAWAQEMKELGEDPENEGELEALMHVSEEAPDEESGDSQELFEVEEFARHAIDEVSADEDEIELEFAAEEPPALATSSRPRNLMSSQVRWAWRAYEGAEHRMVSLRLFEKWNPPVNPLTVDAWRSLERALVATGCDVHRAWVFKDRRIAGSKSRSLHAYGLAIDINHAQPKCNLNRATPDFRKVRFSSAATKEGRCQDVRAGRADTSFTPDQVAAVEAIRTVDGYQVFVWGGRWRSTKDTMHFEINVTPDELARGLQPDPGDHPQSINPTGEAEAVSHEALGGLDWELAVPGMVEPDREHQAHVYANLYGNVAVSTGEFGNALKQFGKDGFVTDDVLWMLKQSPMFMSIVAELDKKYLWLFGDKYLKGKWDANDNGVITGGPFVGRRLIAFQVSSPKHGSFFDPDTALDPGRPHTGDVIHLEQPFETGDRTDPSNFTLDTKGQWLERIAHESVHAFHLVSGKYRGGKTAPERIRARIDDEIATRIAERNIVDEVRRNVPRFAKFQPNTKSSKRWIVERDPFPGKQRRTYLEHFVLSELLLSGRSMLVDKTDIEKSDKIIKKYDEIVEGITLGSPPHRGFLTLNPHFMHPRRGRMPIFTLMFPKVLLALRVIDARWRSVKDLDQRDAQDTTIENMRQEHAKAFFNNLVTYTKLP